MTSYLTGTDRSGSVLLAISAGLSQDLAYSPFGSTVSPSVDDVTLPGFNGEWCDPLWGVTHLGNGYRAYSPTLMRFSCPDSESPFGKGGINAYAYCGSDPVNNIDPSGQQWIIGALIGAVRATRRALTATAATAGKATVGFATSTTGQLVGIGSGLVSTAMNIGASHADNPNAKKALSILGIAFGATTTLSVVTNVYFVWSLRRQARAAARRAAATVQQQVRVNVYTGGRGSDIELNEIRHIDSPQVSMDGPPDYAPQSVETQTEATSSRTAATQTDAPSPWETSPSNTTDTDEQAEASSSPNRSARRHSSPAAFSHFDIQSGHEPKISGIRIMEDPGSTRL
ncbi:RHS repeat-associated core domain-containing protein [Paraburkholderia rhizosphaerae]|uniref:RHS repeat-associated protein n=1 Tax=Paraburkholderia rhizosphaerae TaxID=480658 RepID=A0A4R8LLK8_9BURK|nr:RHS repeat-associated core domain-containing protein [Paraburkholderia rhizosphaerae]TDY45428.1 RHS repeat-associated protein [Paraburkholderia rhizosphaerae]